MKTVLSALLESVAGHLQVFSMAEDFWPLFERCFGSQHNQALAGELRRQWQEGDFGQLPEVEVLPQEVLGDAMGAYAIENRTIYLSDKLLGSFPTATAVDVLLEEIGHHIDALVNREDTPGDEGEIFSYAARNVQLSEQKLSDLKAEDDHSSLKLDNVTVQVEKSDPIVLVVTTTVDEEDGSALIGTGLSLRDAVMIANGNPTISHLIKVASGSTYILSSLVTNGTIAIEADGSATISSDGSASEYLIKNTDSLRVRNISIINPGGLAMLNFHGNLELERSTISNSGSGIFNDLGVLRIDSSEIVNNVNILKAFNFTGAITNRGGFSEIVDSKIANNTSQSGVAGIYNSGTIRILSTEISDNITTSQGYGVALYSDSGQVQIEDSRVTDNVSQSDSQYNITAIGIGGGSIAIKGSTVSGSPNGIKTICEYVEISDSIIAECSFTGMGIDSKYAVVRNNHIEANAAWGLHIIGEKNSVILVENNLVASNSGGVYVGANAASAIISSNQINGNSQGLSLLAYNNASATIASNQINSNGLFDHAGGLSVHGGLSVEALYGARVGVLFNEITENKGSMPNGGGGVSIRTQYGGLVDLSSNIIASNIHEGHQGGGGVGIFARSSEVDLSANQIYSNLSSGFASGGGVSINTADSGAKVSLSSNTITSNISEKSSFGGGGVSVGGSGMVQLLGNTIQSNVGNLGGGVSIGGTVSLAGNTIAGNISKNPYYVHPDYFSDPDRYRIPSRFLRRELEGYDAKGMPIYREWIIDPRYPNIYSPGEILAEPIFTVTSPEPEPNPITPTITLSNANTWLESGPENESDLAFEVKLSSASDEPVRVDYFTVDGSGSYGRLDFLPVFNNTLTFQPGETNKWIKVTAFGSQPITDTTLEIFARDTAYRQWNEADVGKELDRMYDYNDPGYKEYRVNRVFKDTITGFDGVGLASDEKFFLVLANPQNATIASNPDDLLQRVAKESGGSDTEAYAEASSRITGLASSNKTYTYATGVIYDQAKPPVLALRGTEVSGKDLLADFAPEGVGYRQFSSNREKLFDWLREVSTRTAPSITGHSLGGALSQWVTASYDGVLDRVATFNSPGITQLAGFDLSRTTNSGVRHYITSADLVSLVGSTYLNGEWVKSSYRDERLKSIYSRILNKHSTPVVASSISRLSLDQPAPLNRALNSSTANLSDFWFTYLPDPEWLEFQVKIAKLGRPLGPKGSVATAAIAAALTYRGTTELARKGLGYLVDLITDPFDTLSAAYGHLENCQVDLILAESWLSLLNQI